MIQRTHGSLGTKRRRPKIARFLSTLCHKWDAKQENRVQWHQSVDSRWILVVSTVPASEQNQTLIYILVCRYRFNLLVKHGGMKLRHRLTQIRSLTDIDGIRVGLGIVALGIVFLLLLLTVFPTLAPNVLLDLVLTFIAALSGVYLSRAIILHQIARTDRERILAPAAVQERYPEIDGELNQSRLENIRAEATLPDALPVVVQEGLFEGINPSIPVDSTDNVYELPQSIAAFLEPVRDDLLARFSNEGRSNRRLAGIHSMDDGAIRLYETSYFRTYCTNLSPDYTGDSGNLSLRDAFRTDLIADGQLKPLGSTPFSNALSGGGLAVTTDGQTVVGLRSLNVTVDEYELTDSFGSSLGICAVESNGVLGALEQTAEEELRAADSNPLSFEAVYGLGTVRRLDWLGQPNLHGIYLINAPGGLVHQSGDHLESITVSATDHTPITPETLSDPEFARDMVCSILEACANRGLQPGVTLSTTLELWIRHAEGRSESPSPTDLTQPVSSS